MLIVGLIGIFLYFRMFNGFIAAIETKNQLLESERLLLLKTNNELTRTNEEKNKFFSIIAHDLKSPFSGIVGFSEILVDKLKRNETNNVQEISELIRDAASNSLELLENLMTWARSQTGRIHYNPEPLLVKSLLKEISSLFQQIITQKAINLIDQVPAEIQIIADRAMLATTLRNLIANALKFTYPGGTVTVGYKKEVGFHSIYITDTGIGIPRELGEKLFKIDKFVNRSGTNGENSTGLGLLICKEMIDKHGGDIRFESEPEKGTTFYISIPNNLPVRTNFDD